METGNIIHAMEHFVCKLASHAELAAPLANRTRGQWPYRPASKERAMTNRPMILYDLNFLGIHIKENKKSCLKQGSNPGPLVHSLTL